MSSTFKKIQQASVRLTNPVRNFFDFFTGKYTGIVISLLFIWLFTYMFRDLVEKDFKQRTPYTMFITKTCQLWFILLSILIIVHIFI